MQLSVQAELVLTCQRCLNPLHWTQDLQRHYRFVPSESQALAEDDESQEDVLSLDQPLIMSELVEDELIMDLPMIPMHETCPVQVKTVVQTRGFQEQPRPFSVLADLKVKKSD